MRITQIMNKTGKCWVMLLCLLIITGCTTMPRPTDPRDPLEALNRQTFKFDMAMDRAFLRPAAKLYEKIVPAPVDRCITNWFNNVDDINVTANDLLQANIPLALADASRFAINTTLGLLGFFDPATHLGLIRHRQDFGLTLARWGYHNSMYFVIPFFGPSTIRDTIGMPIDYYALSVYPYISNLYIQYGLDGLYYINHRVVWLSADKLIDEAFDPYAFVRSAYLQRRQQQMDILAKDGRIPHESSSYVESQSADSMSAAPAESTSVAATTHDDNDNADTDGDADAENTDDNKQ